MIDQNIINLNNKICKYYLANNRQVSMRQKILYNNLIKSKMYSRGLNDPIHKSFYKIVYDNIEQMKSSILKPFKNICIHGNYPQLIVPALKEKAVENSNNFWVHSHIADDSLKNDTNIEFLDSTVPFNSIKQDRTYDLIISCLEGHHYDLSALFQNYVRKLNPDGAVLGCCLAQNTLKQLRWSYMLAENERSGGISPKVFNFPGLGQLGQSMTTTKMKLPTIVVRDFQIQVNSFVDILTFMQILGQSSHLQGRRKGTYKDLLIAAAAYYDSQFSSQLEDKTKTVSFSIQMGLFIGWKQHESQPKPLKPRHLVGSTFFEQILKQDKDAKVYTISEQSQQPKEIDIKQLNDKNKNKQS